MSTISLQSGVARQAAVVEKAASIPWTIWCAFAGVACGTLGGLACGYVILTTTFGHDEAQREASVGVLGFRGPIGAFIATWGCIAMLTSAPFDNWWHNAYGLDVKILSPPHTLLSLGSLAIKVGALALIAGLINRAG